MIWNKERETLGDSKKKAAQGELLKNQIKRVYGSIPFYKEKLDLLGITPEMIMSVSDIKKLPFTTKVDLRDNYPFGMFAVPMDKIIEIHTSSGTTGKPVVGGYTKKDIDMWR